MSKISATTKGGSSLTPATTVVSETTAGQSPAVGTSLNYAREDHTHGTPAAGAGSGSVVTTVEVNLGAKPVPNGSFTIAGSFTVGKPVMITQAPGPYTGKGTLTDEIEMDQVNVTGYVLNGTTIKCNWGSNTRLYGNVKFNYIVSA